MKKSVQETAEQAASGLRSPKNGFAVGDMVRKIEFGPNAIPRHVEAIGEADYVRGYIRVSGLLGWHSETAFIKAPGA